MKRIYNKGFSLIELIIVIAIMAVLVAIIAPNITKYLGSSKTQADITNLDEVKKQAKKCIAEAVVKDVSVMASATDTQATYIVKGNGSSVSVVAVAGGGGTAEFAGLLKSVFDNDLITKSKKGKGNNIKVIVRGDTSSGYTVECEYTNAS